MDQGFKNLKVYKLAYQLAVNIFEFPSSFPKEETYALTDQIRRSSRSICANITEGYRKRIYPNHFRSKMSDADCECFETMAWLDFAKDCGYMSEQDHKNLISKYREVGKMLGKMIKNPRKFSPRS